MSEHHYPEYPYNEAAYDVLAEKLRDRLGQVQAEFLNVLRLLYVDDNGLGEPITFYGFLQLQQIANEYAKEIIATYKLLVESLTEASYPYSLEAMMFVMPELRNKSNRDSVHWLFNRDLTHSHCIHRENVLYRLKEMAAHSNHRARAIIWDARTHNFRNKEETKAFRRKIYDALAEID